MNLTDITYLLFGAAMPSLDAGIRSDVVELLNDGDADIALDVLIRAVRRDKIPVDAHLLAQASKAHEKLGMALV